MSILLVYAAVLLVTFLPWLVAATEYVINAHKENQDRTQQTDSTDIESRKFFLLTRAFIVSNNLFLQAHALKRLLKKQLSWSFRQQRRTPLR